MLVPAAVTDLRRCRLSAQTLCLPLPHIALRLEQCAAGTWPSEGEPLEGARVAACLRQVCVRLLVNLVTPLSCTCPLQCLLLSRAHEKHRAHMLVDAGLQR